MVDAERVHLINNAGYYLKLPFKDHRPDDPLETLRSNAQAAVSVVTALARLRELDTIVNVVSTSALIYNVSRSNLAYKTAYAASKAAFAQLTSELAYKAVGGRCISVYPRNINTWSTDPEEDSMSPVELAEWLLDLALSSRSFIATNCVVLPAR
jgi:NAD(P)-dependent dehydrogenase (short-subunit alcohol dehydrogenase family)